MKIVGIAVAIALLLAGCGGGSDGDSAKKATETAPTLALLSTTQACTQVQMVNEELDGPGRWPIPTYGEFGEKTAALAGESVPEIASALKSMSDQALKVGGMNDWDAAIPAAAEWATRYQAVADICMRTDSPIGQLP